MSSARQRPLDRPGLSFQLDDRSSLPFVSEAHPFPVANQHHHRSSQVYCRQQYYVRNRATEHAAGYAALNGTARRNKSSERMGCGYPRCDDGLRDGRPAVSRRWPGGRDTPLLASVVDRSSCLHPRASGRAHSLCMPQLGAAGTDRS